MTSDPSNLRLIRNVFFPHKIINLFQKKNSNAKFKTPSLPIILGTGLMLV